MASARAGQAAAEAFGKVGTVKVPRDANGAEPATDTPGAPPSPQELARGRERSHIREERAAAPPPDAVPEMDDTALLSRWRWQLGATARKAAATRVKAEAAMNDWERLVADAEKAGVPVRLVVAAAADAGMDI